MLKVYKFLIQKYSFNKHKLLYLQAANEILKFGLKVKLFWVCKARIESLKPN